VLTGLALPLVATAPAMARLDDGEAPTHTGWLFVVLIYIAIPLAFFLLVAALVFGPSVRRRPRYRPAREWKAEAVWFNGPEQPEQALVRVHSLQVKGGGASAGW
jgi:hypothetical protein